MLDTALTGASVSHAPPPWPLQDIRLLLGCCAGISHFFHSPRPPALPTLVQYYCTMIWTVYDSPFDLPFVCYTPYKNIGNNNIV